MADDATANDIFGLSVATNGSIAVVGAHGNDDNGTQSGSAYLYDASTGKQIAKLLPSDGAAHDWFGNSVAIGGTTVIVGALSDDDNGNASGSAYIFDISDPMIPVQITKLLANDGVAFDQFGVSVAIDGETVMVGAYLHGKNEDNSGAAYLFDTTSGLQIAKLLAVDGEKSDKFGNSVALNSDIAIIGALLDNDNGNDSGSAYLFDTTTCLGDLNGDESVGVTDLLVLLAFWGPCEPVCLGDLDDDGSVGTSDLLILLSNWGPCP